MENAFRRFPNLSRRGFLVAGGMTVTAIAALPGTPACTRTSEQEEGPYYIDDETLRRDIAEAKPGVPLILAVRLFDVRNCAPMRRAALDIWHCDALGVYSGFTANSPDGGPGGMPGRGRPGPPPEFQGGDGFARGTPPPGFDRGGPGGPRSGRTDATRFLRGVQISDDNGLAEFSTVYPGWYAGRAIHIHAKVHIGGEAARKYSGGHVAHTGQFFFPEDLTERVARIEPYAKWIGVHRTTQAEDGVFNSQHGAACMLNIERLGKTDRDGFRATVTLAIDPEAIPAPVGGFGGPGPGRPFPR
jgi:protocatechuate 3,4-dioxygenase beta subunit